MAQSDSVTELDLDSIINKLLNHSSGQYITHTYVNTVLAPVVLEVGPVKFSLPPGRMGIPSLAGQAERGFLPS